MKKIKLIAVLLILLFTSNVAFSQTPNPFVNFNPEKLKENSDYTDNFNPGRIDYKILYRCMIDMIDLARKEYFYLEPFKHDIRLDSTAQMQADYQALKDLKTDQNEMRFRTFESRLNKYGLSANGVELLAKAKAYQGIEDYSYYDLCVELIMPFLKNIKTAKVLLNKRYSYIGFGFAPDENMRSIYASFVLGNDLIFNEKKQVKDLPYSKGKTGLLPYNEKICAKCAEDASLEELSDFISVKNFDVIFTTNDAKNLRKMIGKDGDAFVLDFVQHLQYDCEGNVLDNDHIHRGFVTKPITYEKILSANEIADPKSTKIKAKIANVPEEIDPASDFDINIIVLKEGKYACRTIIKKSIETNDYAYTEKINLMKDVDRVKSMGDWVPVSEESVIELIIPFSSKKMEFTEADIEVYLKELKYPKFKVSGLEVIAHNSLNYAKDPTQLKNQKRRAESISKTLAKIYPGVAPAKILYDDGWDDFKRDLVHSSEYYDLMLGTKEQAIKKLTENGGKIAKDLEEEYLKNHRYAKIKISINYLVDEANEQNFVSYKFNTAIEEKNFPLAISIQQYIIQQVENKTYTDITIADTMLIPEKKDYLSFLINKLYIKRFLSKTMNDELVREIESVLQMLPTDPIAHFNMGVAKVEKAVFNTIADVTKLQAEIDRLYAMTTLPKDKINDLNVELQFKIIDFLGNLPPSTERNNLLTSTYNKIKTIRNSKLSSWQNAYKLAAYFAKNREYMYALSLMDPFLDEPTISDNFVFSYISMGAHREDSYLSSLFTKAVKIGSERKPARLCGLFDHFAISVFDNDEVKKIVCKTCNR